jgi:glyoxylase-like metal-dependent hydrolase (beta-lactamase superfamily II)
MKIISVKGHQNVYTSNVYLVLGEWKRICDIHTLIDVGNDPSIISVLETTDTGVGKNKVERIILTHGHSDHTGILPLLIQRFHPEVCAFSPFIDGVTRILKNGEIIRLGERDFEVIHTPGHTEDSVCLLNEEAGVLFTGDMPLPIRTSEGTYMEAFYQALRHLSNKKIQIVYPGHGAPLTEDVTTMIRESMKNVRNTRNKQSIGNVEHTPCGDKAKANIASSATDGDCVLSLKGDGTGNTQVLNR